jgi:hypothetical protein
VPVNTVIVTLYFQFAPETVTCEDLDPSAAAAFVLQRAQSLAGTTGRTFSAGPAPTCTDAPVPAGGARRHLLQTTQAVLVTKVTSIGPKPAGDVTAAASDLARLVQSTVQSTLVEVLEAAVKVPGFDAAEAAAAMNTQLAQIELEGRPLLSSPPPPVVELGEKRPAAGAPGILRPSGPTHPA